MEKKTTTRCERILAAFSHLKMKGLVKSFGRLTGIVSLQVFSPTDVQGGAGSRLWCCRRLPSNPQDATST